MYLGDLERLQDIQKKRDATNRDWQRIVLRNVGKSFGWDMGDSVAPGETTSSGESKVTVATGPRTIETRKLWWKIHEKMQSSDYSNMVLLAKMEDVLEGLINRKQKFITKASYEKIINKIHLDTEGKIVEPFVALEHRQDREEQQRLWYESLALDLEEECLIK